VREVRLPAVVPIVIGRRIGHYLVQERLGAGGMGEVHAALDTRLGRRVAVKVLRSDLAADPGRQERFRREAKAVAALKHPGIVTIHGVEEEEGLLFLILELVEGTSLRDRIDQGPLPVDAILDVGAQIGEALASAHDAGILHRDLKPQNVMLTTDGRVKLLDFGLAKSLGPRESDPDGMTMTRHTREGMMVGTAGYMAPEQALGKGVDVRADVFALGVVLYEMATGKSPFRGGTLAAFFDSLLNEPPASPASANPALPAGLVRVLDKALQKDPARRHATARDLVADLKAVAEGKPVSTTRSSIAVLPFADLSPGKDQEYFCQGLAEELIDSLGALRGLRVVARSSAFAVQAEGLDAREVGRRLQVDTVLEGSVRKAGTRLRITTQLVDAADGYQIWSRRFDRELDDVFAVQDQIARTVAAELRTEVGAPAEPRPARQASVQAYEAYLRGLYAMNRWTEDWVERAVGCFEEAVAGDPGYAPAHAALADCLVWFYSGIGTRPAATTIPRARDAARRSLELDPALADGHKVLGLIAMSHDWDRASVERAFTRALELNPGSADLRVWNGWRLSLLEGSHEAALGELRTAETLDPLDLRIKTRIGYVYYFVRDLDRAAAQFRSVLDVDPHFAFAHYALGDVLAQQGRYEEAVGAVEESIRLGGSTANHLAILAHVHGLAGRTDQARALLAEVRERAEKGQASPIWAALAHLGLAEADAAFAWLDRAFAERDGSLILVAASPEFDPLRGDPRFRALLERMGLGHRAAQREATRG
jgi:eukaryotic-like serine/threonine-protein kinase